MYHFIFQSEVLSHSNYPPKKDKLGNACRVTYVRREFLVSLPSYYVLFFPIYSTSFFTLDDTNARKHFLKAMNSAHDSGDYMCQLNDVALNQYIMELTDSFKSQRKLRKYNYKGGSILPRPQRAEHIGAARNCSS